MKLTWINMYKFWLRGGEDEMYLCKYIFAVSLLKEEEINDPKTAEIKHI